MSDDEKPEGGEGEAPPAPPAEEHPPLTSARDIDTPIPPGGGWIETPPTDETYGAMWACYRDGVRSLKEICKRAKVCRRTAITAIRRGWPAAGLPALSERIKLWEKQRDASRQQQLAADRVAAEAVGKTEAQRWKQMVDILWPIVINVATTLGKLEKRARDSVEMATLIRYRTVRKEHPKTGKVRKVSEAYISASEHARVMQVLTGALKELPNVSKIVLGPAAQIPEPEVPKFTQEQLDQLANGVMPEGVTEELLGLALLKGAFKT